MADLNEAKLEALLEIINSSARQAIAEYKKTGHGVPSADATTPHPLDLEIDTVDLRKAIRLLNGAYQQLSAILTPPQNTLLNFIDVSSYVCTDIAARAGIADVLDQYPEGLSVDKLADAVKLDKSNTARIVRYLSVMGCFKEVERDVFANNRLSLILKSSSNAGCFIRMFSPGRLECSTAIYEVMSNPELAKSRETNKAPHLLALKKEGIQVEDNRWDTVKNDPKYHDTYHRAMLGTSETSGSLAVLHHYPWGNTSSMVDIGCGTGGVSMPLAKMFPNLRITNQDLPETTLLAQKVWEKNAPETLLDGRVTFVPLNFLKEIPVIGKDVYYMRNILHDWPDADAMTILRNIRKAMGPHSRVLIHECTFFHPTEQSNVKADGLSIAPEPLPVNFGAGSRASYNLDIMMWFIFNSKERTLNDLMNLGAAADLVFNKVYDLVDTMVVEFRIADD